MIGYPVDDAELDTVEDQAVAMVEAILAHDMDTAYIISQTCHDPSLLAMFAIEIALRHE